MSGGGTLGLVNDLSVKLAKQRKQLGSLVKDVKSNREAELRWYHYLSILVGIGHRDHSAAPLLALVFSTGMERASAAYSPGNGCAVGVQQYPCCADRLPGRLGAVRHRDVGRQLHRQ